MDFSNLSDSGLTEEQKKLAKSEDFKMFAKAMEESGMMDGMKLTISANGFTREARAFLRKDNGISNRKFVRKQLNTAKEELEKEFGQSLFDEEFDNKVYNEK